MSRIDDLLTLLALLGRFGLAVVFLRAGLAKLPARGEFAEAVAGYGLLPRGLATPVATLLPPMEAGAAALLAIGVATGLVALGLGVSLLAFAAAVAINLLRGRRIDCGCSGPAPSEITWRHVVCNLALTGLAAIVARWSPAALSLWPRSIHPPVDQPQLTAEQAGATLLAGGAVTAAAALLVLLVRCLRAVPVQRHAGVGRAPLRRGDAR